MIEVGDLVQITSGGKRSLQFPALGYGCVTKVFRDKIVYVCWLADGYTKPYNIVWLEKVA